MTVIHRFMLEAVPETARMLKARGIGHVFYLPRKRSDADDILYRLSERAAARRHNARVPAKIAVAYFAVAKRENAAFTIRPKTHRALPDHLHAAEPLNVKRKWTSEIPSFQDDITGSRIFTGIAGCAGARRSSNGRAPIKKPWRP